jgi:threonine dehydrogenase-like Zn-dependent dehydrogenase
MRATLIYGAGDVRVEDVHDAALREPTDALVRVLRACICGSDLWPYGSMEPTEQGARIGHEFIGVAQVPLDFGPFMRNITLTGGVAPARAYIEELMPDVLDGTIQPGRVFDRAISLEEIPDGYRAMADREAIKVVVQP